MSGILCGHCGERHPTVADVRSCTGTLPAPDDLPGLEPDDPSVLAVDFGAMAPKSRARTVEPAAGDLAVLAGPDCLGRSVVVAPGQDVPPPWTDAPRVVVDEEADVEELVERLDAAWRGRERVVIELGVDLPEEPTGIETAEPWTLEPSFTFPLDRLSHLVRANAVDARDEPTFLPRSQAIAAGATAGDDTDVRLPDGREAWCDGGPLDVELARTLGLPLLPALSVERGHLEPFGLDPPTADLAADQLAAVAHRGGPCRVISPAGSGKTRTLTERARHLVRDQRLPPGALGLVAYNVRAAGEMRERLEDAAGLDIRTLNSLGLAVLTGRGPFRVAGSSQRDVGVLEEADQRRILDALVDFPRRANTDPAAAWLEALGRIRLGLRPPREVEDEYGGDVDGLADVFPRYQEALANRGVVDFDQQIYGAVQLLLTEPAVRAVAQRASRVLLVDEFQDLTPAHLLLLRLLAAPGFDVFGVGDDDQTIYGYNGADPTWLIDFQRFFAGAGHHPLTVNYRCPPPVVDAARTLLTHNRRRVDKVIHPAPGRTGTDDQLAVRSAERTVAATVEAVAERIAAGAAPDDIAVLTRVNATLAPVQVALDLAGIPADRVAGPAWLQRTGVRSALAWLRLATTRGLDPADVGDAARRPSRGLSAKVIEWMAEQRDASGIDRLAGRLSRDRDREKVEGFAADLRSVAERARGGTSRSVLLHVRDGLGLDGAMAGLDRSRGRVDRSSHTDDLDALIQLADLHEDAATFGDWLADRLRAGPPPAGPRVRLSTVHRVKGLEWPHVVVHEVSAGLFPHRLAEDVEEERRVFHVALTRCSASVTVVAPAEQPSRFIEQLTREARPGEVDDVKPLAPPREQPKAPTRVDGPGDGALRDRLQSWRLDRSRTDGVPAYVVFNNKTLDDLVARRPATYIELRACTGIGPAKIEAYGDDLLALVAAAES